MGIADLQPFGEELVLLVLGPGFGESVLVRWPPDNWLVVDSCHRVAGEAERHPAIEALRAFDAQPAGVALTHPHLDHSGGFAALVARRRPGAPVGWLSEPDRGVWWATPNGTRAAVQGDTEHALAAIERAWGEDPATRWELLAGGTPMVLGELTIEVLSPAAGVVDEVKAAAHPDFNRASSAMLLRWRDCELVLGADLTHPGWDDVMSAHGPRRFAEAHGLKASHHGSANAQHAVALGDPPARERLVVATPYNKGRKVPGYNDGGDVARLLELATRLHVTTHHGPLPLNGATGAVSRSTLCPTSRRLARFEVQTDNPPKRLEDCWIAARFGADGSLRGLARGPASLEVVE